MKSKLSCEQIESDPLKIHPALKEYFGYILKKSAILFKHMQEKALEPYDLIPPHIAILKILMITPALNQMTLSDELGIDKATMVKLIDHLEKKKLVRRVTDSKDRRGKLIEITPTGHKKFDEMANLMREVGDEFLAPLTKSQSKELHSLLLKLISRS
jgi:DNA-binding MarR family transcriptional regulator